MGRTRRRAAATSIVDAGTRTIDLNADVGESYAAWTMGNDPALLPLVTSANVACGAHAGDPAVMDRTVALCRQLGVAVGAHLGYPDLAGFGRRDIEIGTDELRASLLAQLGGLAAIARARHVELRHVKAHGALYNRAAGDPALAGVIAGAVASFSTELTLVGPPGSAILAAGDHAGLK